MNTLWIFGDSLSDFFNPPSYTMPHWRHEYIEWKGYIPKVYAEILSEHLNYKLNNKAVAGNSNQQIFSDICEFSNEIQNDDLIIIGWTSQERFRLVDKNNKWINIHANYRTKDKNEKLSFFLDETMDRLSSISKETIQQILFNRTNQNYLNEIKNWIKLLNLTFGNKIIHWSWDDRLNETTFIIPLNKFQSIKMETNGELDDRHWSENGQIEMANFMMEIIQNRFIKKNLL